MQFLTYTSLYPNCVTPTFGIFVENRLRKILEYEGIEADVVAPVKWLPLAGRYFGAYRKLRSVQSRETRYGISVLHPRFPVLPKIGVSVAPILMAAATIRAVRERIEQRGAVDFIDAHYFYPDGVAATIIGSLLSIPVVITARGTDVNVLLNSVIPRMWMRWAASRARGIITVSEALRQKLFGAGITHNKVTVIPNGVDTKAFFKPEDRQAVRAKLGMRGSTILCVGNLVEEKGHELIVEALAHLHDYELVIIGEGPDSQKLRSLASDLGVDSRIRFVGRVDHLELQSWYGAADVLALASKREGWPNVILEAMACGTPVVASNVGGVAEIVTSKDVGCLVNTRSAEDFANAIRETVVNGSDRDRVCRFARSFQWANVARKQVQWYRDVVF